jgi:glycerophosphoryl diester phosphodiesterase
MRQPKKLAIILAIIVVVFAAGYWFATGGVPDRDPAAWLDDQPIAHRGNWAEGSERPENSLASFEEAAKNGYAIELDVQLTSDGEVAVFHDASLERMTGADGTIADSTLAELRELRLLGGEEGIPTLAEALDVINGRVPVLVEIKNAGDVGALEDEVARQLSSYAGDVAVMSFNPYSVAEIAEAAPQIQRGQLSTSFEGEDLAFYQIILLRNLLMNWTSQPDFIAYDLLELPSTTTTIQTWRGRLLLGWTAESKEQRASAEEFCDAVICNPGALQ